MADAAQNQHYVPKFILRQFVLNRPKEHVAVYDKHTDKTFVTAIKNIMAERRFNDFSIGDKIVSFEPVACRIEDAVLPIYQRVIETRCLDKTAETQAALALLIAFQFVRSKTHRNFRKSLNDAVEARVAKMGHRMEEVAG